jgi:hypothetical protein
VAEGTVLFATDVTKPDENRYPPSGYLIGPLEIYLNPYQSKSGYTDRTLYLLVHYWESTPITAMLEDTVWANYVNASLNLRLWNNNNKLILIQKNNKAGSAITLPCWFNIPTGNLQLL